MRIILVTAKYNAQANAVEEHRAGTRHTVQHAINWLNSTEKPAMFYIDGTQNLNNFLKVFCVENEKYQQEYAKVKD